MSAPCNTVNAMGDDWIDINRDMRVYTPEGGDPDADSPLLTPTENRAVSPWHWWPSFRPASTTSPFPVARQHALASKDWDTHK